LTVFEIGLLLVRGKTPRLSVWLIDLNDSCSETSRYLSYYRWVVCGVPGIREIIPDL